MSRNCGCMQIVRKYITNTCVQVGNLLKSAQITGICTKNLHTNENFAHLGREQINKATLFEKATLLVLHSRREVYTRSAIGT